MVQVDTLDVRPLPGMVLKHFTARDVVSRWDVVEAHSRATARTAAGFLDALQARMPFPVRAIQVDGGSEFQQASSRNASAGAYCSLSCHPDLLSPNPPKDTDGRREDSGRGWVRELQGRWPGVLG